MYLTLEHLIRIFPSRACEGEVTAVDDVSLGIAQGEFVTVILARSPGVQTGEERRVGSCRSCGAGAQSQFPLLAQPA